MLERARFLYQAGYSVVLIDLQAHGESPGNIITVGHLEQHDVRAAVEYAKIQHPGENVAVLGVSLGGASAVLASPLGINAMILEAVYPDIETAIHNRTSMRLGIFGWFPAEVLLAQLPLRLGISSSDLRPVDRIDKVECPILIISGTEDLHTTVKDTGHLFNAALPPKELWLVSNVAHVDIYRAKSREYESRVLKFLGQNLKL